MTSKLKQVPNNLFTLNQSKNLDDRLKSQQSSIFDQPSEIDINENIQDISREHLERQSFQLQSQKKQITSLKQKIKQLKDSLDIAQLHNAKHEEKQRQLIKKLSHEQISNKQLEYEIKRASQEILKIKENTKFSEKNSVQMGNLMKKVQEERAILIGSFKKISQAIARCERIQDFQICVGKFLDFIKKNMKIYQSSQKVPQYEFQLKFQLGQMNSLKQKLNQTESKLSKQKQQLQKQKIQKKRIISTYNQKISKLKQQSDLLRLKIDQRDSEIQDQISSLKKVLSQKNELIYVYQLKLKNKLESQKKRKDSVASRKSRVGKRSFYISDGEKEHGDFKMSQLENQIESLERQLIEELKE